MEHLLDDPEYFLSADNPAATLDQKLIESTALEIIKSPIIAAAREQVKFMWRAIVGSDPRETSWALFDASIEEYCFNCALKAAASDANFPRVISTIYAAPHQWFGMDVPGSRLAGDNPDNQYIVIPVDSTARFELYGKRSTPAPGDVNITLMGNTGLSKTMASIEGRDLVVDENGYYTVTIDPLPADGRANHLPSRQGAMFVFIRESRSDWTQKPSRLRISRLDPPAAPPHSFDMMVERAAEIMIDDVPGAYWWMRLSHALVPNTMSTPFKTVKVGGLYAQQVSFGHLRLADDEAFVITVDPGGAGFRNLVLHDYWYVSMNVGERFSCLNSGQAAPDEDGRFTYVVCKNDPGLQNWLDPVGQNELLVVHRWQKLPREEAAGGPKIHGQLLKLEHLAAHLPVGVQKIDAAGRAALLAKRGAEFRQRFALG